MRRRFFLILICASIIGFLASFLVYRVVSQAALARSDQSELSSRAGAASCRC